MKRWLLAIPLVLGCRGEEPARTNAPETAPAPSASVVASATASPSAAPSATSTDSAPAASSSATADPPVACAGAALTQSVFIACRTRVLNPANASKLTLTASPLKIALAAGASAEVTFVLKNEDTVKRTVDLEIPTSNGIGSNVRTVLPLDLQLASPKLDLECFSNGGPVKSPPPPTRPDQVEVQLEAGGTLTWKRKVDAMQHGWVMDRAKLVGYTGSGTPCMEWNVPVAKGTQKVSAPSLIKGVPPVILDVTIQ